MTKEIKEKAAGMVDLGGTEYGFNSNKNRCFLIVNEGNGKFCIKINHNVVERYFPGNFPELNERYVRVATQIREMKVPVEYEKRMLNGK